MRSPMILSLALALAAMSAAGAADAQQAKAEQLVEITGIEQNFAMMQQQLMQGAVQSYMIGAQERGLDEAQATSGRPAMDPVFEEIRQALSWDAMRTAVVAAYAEVFTDAEIDAALAFYSSAEGRGFLSKQPQLIERGSEVAQQRMSEAMPRIQAGIEAALDSAAATPAGGG